LSSYDTGSKDPNFDELKKFILAKAQTPKLKVVYNKERVLEDSYDGLQESVWVIAHPRTPVTSTPIVPTPVAPPMATPTAAPIDTAITELTKQFSQLALFLKANIESAHPTAPTAPQVRAPFRQFDWPRYCIWCDATEYSRYHCPEFPEAIRQDLIQLNEWNHVVNAATGLELPLMFGKGGMKMLLEQQTTASNNVFMATATNITIDDLCGQLGENSVMITSLDFENNTRTDEIIDVEVGVRGDEIKRVTKLKFMKGFCSAASTFP